MSATINKQLNDIFEDVYHLFNDSIMVPEYLKKPEIERCVFEFMEKIDIQSEWDMTDDERKELNGKYFEAGHNGVDAVFYPFNSEESNCNPIKIQNTINVWENALISIQSYCKDKELVEKANALEERIDNLKYY
jgi:hypothetical protein